MIVETCLCGGRVMCDSKWVCTYLEECIVLIANVVIIVDDDDSYL